MELGLGTVTLSILFIYVHTSKDPQAWKDHAIDRASVTMIFHDRSEDVSVYCPILRFPGPARATVTSHLESNIAYVTSDMTIRVYRIILNDLVPRCTIIPKYCDTALGDDIRTQNSNRIVFFNFAAMIFNHGSTTVYYSPPMSMSYRFQFV